MKVGILGAGGMGATHARHYRSIAGVEVHIFDVDQAKVAAVAQQHGATVAESVDQIIRDCDAVDVCLPTDLHLEFGSRALDAGKALMMEKPLTRTFAEGAALVEKAAQKNVPFMVAQVVRFFPEFRAARNRVVSGAIGRPAVARTRRGGLPPRTDWFKDTARSGGILLDLAVHDFDWLRWTLGEVETVSSRSYGINHGIWPDYALTLLQFDSGAIAHVESTWADPGGGRVTFEVCGSDGMIEHDSRRVQTLRGAVIGDSGTQTSMESPLAGSDDPYLNQLKGFVHSVRTGGEPPVPGIEGLRTLAVALAAIESAESGQKVRVQRV